MLDRERSMWVDVAGRRGAGGPAGLTPITCVIRFVSRIEPNGQSSVGASSNSEKTEEIMIFSV